MFSNNSYVKIKSVEDKGNYSVCKISSSRKNKTNNQFETDFVANVRFVGDAHKQRPMADQRIKITSCGVTNCYTKDGKLEFNKAPTYCVFGYELQADSPNSPNAIVSTIDPIVDSELPF